MSVTNVNNLLSTLADNAQYMEDDNFKHLIGQIKTVVCDFLNRVVSRDEVDGKISQLECMLMKYNEDRKHERDIINSMKQTINELNSKITVLESEKLKVKAIETELNRSKYTQLALQIFECYRRVELHCIKETLNFNDLTMNKEGIYDFNTFKQYLNICGNNAEHYMNNYRQQRNKLLGNSAAHNMRKLKDIRNNCAHPVVPTNYTIDIDYTSKLLGIDSKFLEKLIITNKQIIDIEDDDNF